MKLFRCTVELTVMVLAETESDARACAARALLDDRVRDADIDARIERERMLCGDWEPACLVYGDHRGDITLEQAWDMMGIPKPK